VAGSVAAVVGLWCLPPAGAATPPVTVDWPQLQGSNRHTGYVGSETAVVRSNAATLAQRWDDSAPTLGGARGGAAIVDGTAYVNAPNLAAVDVATGAVKWQSTVFGHGTPAVADGIAVTVTSATVPFVVAVDASTGATLWQRRLPRFASTSTSVTISGSRVFVAVNDDVWALWLKSGRVDWTSPFVNRYVGPGSTPTVGQGVVLVGASGSDVTAFDATTGSRLWTVRTSAGNLLGDNLWTPVVKSGTVYTGTADGFAALNLTSGAVIWQNASLGTMAWPIVATSTALIGSNESEIAAVSLTDGTVLWRQPIAGVWDVSGFGDLVWGQQLIDGATPSVNLVALDRRTGSVAAQFALPSSFASPRPSPTLWGSELVVPYWRGVRMYALP
jgi:outer membrane protein assembly factor BamB